MGQTSLQRIAMAFVLAAACDKEPNPGPAAGTAVAPMPVPTGGTAGAAGTGGMGGMLPPTGGTAPLVPGFCDTSAWAQDSSMYEQAFLDAINAARAANRGCPEAPVTMPAPLVLDMSLQLVARCHALEMSMRGELTVDGADGSNTFDRAMRAGYAGTSTATTVTASARDVAMVLEGLLVEPSVCEKLADPQWLHVGVGASPPSDTGKRYINIVTGF